MNITNQRKKNKAIASLLTGVLSLQSVLPLLFASTILTGLFFNNPKPADAEGWDGPGIYMSRASESLSGEGANNDVFDPTVSSNGRYVAFRSAASNLVNGDNNGVSDVFRKDLETGEIIRVSTDVLGVEANGASYDASVSADGRYIAFSSLASNLVSDDSNSKFDVFRKDLQTGEIVRISTDTSGNQVNDRSDSPSISQDGRYVAFVSRASNLIANDINNKDDIFRKDLQNGEIIRVSTDSSGNESNGHSYVIFSYASYISSDGRYVTFMSDASNLVLGDTGQTDIFRKDLITGEILRVSIGALGEPNDFSESPSISSDGRFVAFSSYASNLVEDDNSNSDIFIKDLQTGEMVMASANSSGGKAIGDSYYPSISSDGRYVSFASYATNLAIGKNYTGWDIFRKDILTGEINRISINPQGEEANNDSFFTDINSDGRFIVFTSDASNLVDNDTNAFQDIFVADLNRHPITAPLDYQGPSVIITNPLENISTNGVPNINATIDDTATGNSKITEAYYFVDSGPLIQLVASDGFFDSPVENVTGTYNTKQISNGNHTLTVTGKDETGNWGVTSTINFKIYNFYPPYYFITKWGSYGSGDGQFNKPEGVAIDSSGYVYVADLSNQRIQKFDSNGNFVTKWGTVGAGNGQFATPNGIAVDLLGNVYVADGNNYRIQKFDSNGTFITKWGTSGTGDGQFSGPNGVALDSESNVYVTEWGNHRIQKFDSNGTFITKWGTNGTGDGQFSGPNGVALDSLGNIYVADCNNHRIQKFDSNGNFVTKWGSYGSLNGRFVYPYGVTVDSSNHIYVADSNNHRIQKFDSNGNFVTKWGSQGAGDGQFSKPERLAADLSGNVFVSDRNNNNLQKFSPIPPSVLTPVGAEIRVDFVNGIELTFNQVTFEGITSFIESESSPPPPGGFNFLSHHYDISTSASYSGNIRVAIPYDPAEVTGNEDDLRLFHYENGNWVDVTVLPVDTANNKITGEVTSLSPFAIGEPVDIQGPIATVSNPTNNAAVSGTINIDATVDDSTAGNSNIAEALYRIDDGVPVQMNASDDSFNSTTENVKAQLDTTTLPNGNHTISVLGKDSAGNWSSASSVNVVVKNYSLIAEITYPDPESPQTPFSGTIHVTGVAKHLDKNKFSKYVLQYQKTHALDGSAVTNPAWKLIISSTEMVDDATLGKWITTSMPGIYKLRLSVYDINGNVATDTKYMRIENPAPLSTDPDTTKPVINISNISTDDNLKGKKTIKGKVFDENLSIYALQRRIDSPTSSWVTAAYSKENVNVEGATIAKWDTTKLNGKYYLRLRATDKAANTAYYPQGSDIDYTKGIKVLIDNKAPTLGAIYPKSGIFTSSLSSIYISGAYDLNPLKTTAYTTGINGDGISMKINSDENIAAYESDNKKIMYDITESLLDGNYSVEFSVPDNVGNASTFKTNFTIDSTNPTASISLARDSIKAGNKLTISGKATDKNIKSWALYQSPPTTIAYTKLTSGLTNVGKDNLNASLLIWTTPKAIGTYELKLDVTDKAGNKSTDEKTITIDNSSLFEEKAEVTYPQDNSILKGTVPVIGSATTVPTLAYYTISRKLSTTAPTTETVMYKGLSPVEDGTLSNLNLSALNGKYGLIIKRYRVGSTLPYGESVSISNLTIDNVAPIIPSVKALSSVTGGYVKSPNPTIEIKATETNSGIDETKTSVKIDGTPVSLDFSEDGNATFDSLANKIYVTLGYLDDGKHTLSVNLSDKATNPSKTYSYTFYVDTDTLDIPIPPIAEISSPMNESGFTLGATIPIVGSAYDPNILNYTLWYKKEGTLTYTKLFSGTTNIFEATLTSFKPTSKGTYEIKIVLTDKAINTPKESSVNVTIQ